MVDDDAMVRRLLRQILTSPQIEVVAEASDGDEVVDAVNAHRPNVVVMDLRMERVSGIEAAAALVALTHAPGVIGLTSFDTRSAILDAVDAGMQGFLAKDADPEELRGAVIAVAQGHGALSPRAAGVVLDRVHHDTTSAARREAQRRLDVLTDREREVALAVAEGLTNTEIAASLFMAEATVKTHLTRTLAKLDLGNRVQLAVLVGRAS